MNQLIFPIPGVTTIPSPTSIEGGEQGGVALFSEFEGPCSKSEHSRMEESGELDRWLQSESMNGEITEVSIKEFMSCAMGIKI